MRLTKDQKKEKYSNRASAGVRRLDWDIDFDNTHGHFWFAMSQINDEGSRFSWRITVTDIGRFTIANSDGELINPKKYQQGYTSLQAAQNVCQSLEDGLVVSLTKHPE